MDPRSTEYQPGPAPGFLFLAFLDRLLNWSTIT
nr:MAG TPA: hypothetical protein [Caudoviricetes sp.]